MTKRSRRIWMGLGLVAIGGALALLVGEGLSGNIVYFLTPSELHAEGATVYDRPVRLGGQVKPGSVEWSPETGELHFVIIDDSAEVRVRNDGAPPAMFQEGMGVVVEGRYREGGVFSATNLMVKHSNEYAPPEDAQHPRRAYETLLPEGGREGGN